MPPSLLLGEARPSEKSKGGQGEKVQVPGGGLHCNGYWLIIIGHSSLILPLPQLPSSFCQRPFSLPHSFLESCCISILPSAPINDLKNDWPILTRLFIYLFSSTYQVSPSVFFILPSIPIFPVPLLHPTFYPHHHHHHHHPLYPSYPILPSSAMTKSTFVAPVIWETFFFLRLVVLCHAECKRILEICASDWELWKERRLRSKVSLTGISLLLVPRGMVLLQSRGEEHREGSRVDAD